MKIELVRIYTKDLSLENPHAPAVFREQWAPQVDLQLHAGGTRFEDGLVEATLKVNVEASLNGRPAMVVEVVVAGLFRIEGMAENELARAFGVTCPTILYPYACETVTALSIRGGFPPFLMQPANFEEIHRRRGDANGAPAPQDGTG